MSEQKPNRQEIGNRMGADYSKTSDNPSTRKRAFAREALSPHLERGNMSWPQFAKRLYRAHPDMTRTSAVEHARRIAARDPEGFQRFLKGL